MKAQAAPRPLSLRLSVTDQCPLGCAYCRPAFDTTKAPGERPLSFEEITGFVRAIKSRFGISQVRLTGGEPLLRAGLARLVSMLAGLGVPDLALTTNGQVLEKHAESLRRAGLGRVNISLDTLKPALFTAVTRGGALAKTLAGIGAAQRAGLDPIKLNTVVLRGQNDREAVGLVRFAIEHNCQVRFLELMPIGEAAGRFPTDFVSSAEVRRLLAREFALTALPFDPQSTSRNFRIEDHNGGSAIAGFISPYSEPFCEGCWRLRLTASGVLIGCLARSEGIPIAPLLCHGSEPDLDALGAAVEEALRIKRRNHEFLQPRAMVGIGG